MKVKDRKLLWGRSGNICSFPGCSEKLAHEDTGSRVAGEEAHIKGEKPGAPRYDTHQSDAERDNYENRIVLCPNHHTEVDSKPDKWTVESLIDMKKDHEIEIEENQQFPKLRDDLVKLVQEYSRSHHSTDFLVSDVIESAPDVKVLRVNAEIESGVNTNITVHPGQRLSFFARGLISYDGGIHFSTPEGVICNEYGLPLLFEGEDGRRHPAVWPHDGAYRTDGGELGRIGSLIGWIGTYSEDSAFLIGAKREIEVCEGGVLFLVINDAKGAYSDNDGEFRVDLRVESCDLHQTGH